MSDKKNGMRNVATPKQTGGGGFTFEDKVTAWFCSHFLGNTLPFNKEVGKIIRMDFQVRPEGWLFDDLLLTLKNKEEEKCRIAISVKSNVQFNTTGPSDDLKNDLWNQFVGEPKRVFDPSKDYLCIVNSTIPASISEDLKALLAAASSMDPKVFLHRITSEDGGFSQTKKQLFDSFQCPAAIASAHKIIALDTVKLLSRIFLFEFDFQNTNSSDENLIIKMLADILLQPDGIKELDMYYSMCNIGREYAPVSGYLDYTKLLNRFGINYELKAFPNHKNDWSKIHAQSSLLAGLIQDSIGGKLKLDRTIELNNLKKCIDDNQVVFVLGKSGFGKSVLVKDMIRRVSAVENNFIWIDAQCLNHGGLSQYFGLQHSITQLFEYSKKTCSYLIIDGIDRFFREEDLKQLHEILSKAVVLDSGWKVIFTCQSDDYSEVIERLYRINIPLKSESYIVDLNISNHLAAIYKEIPQLSDLFKHAHLHAVLNNLKYLDLLAFKLLSGKTVPENGFLGETTIIDWIWKEEFDSTGSRFMQEYAAKQAQMFSASVPATDFSISELIPLEKLKSGKKIYENDDKLYLTHDLLGDWARYKILRSRDANLKPYLLSLELGSPLWRKAIRLYGIYLLEKNDEGNSWKILMRSLSEHEPGEKIVQDLLLESIFFSSDTYKYLTLVYDVMKEDEGKLFNRFIGQFLIKATVPNRNVMDYAKKQGKLTAAEAASYHRIPDFLYWPGLIEFLYEHKEEAIEITGKKLAVLCSMWLDYTELGFPFRKEVAAIALENAHRMFSFKFNGGYISGDSDQFVFKAFLAGVNEYPKEVSELALKLCKRIKSERLPKEKKENEIIVNPVKSFISAAKIRNETQWPDGPYERVDDAFAKICLNEHALNPLIALLPQKAMEITLALLIERPKEVSFAFTSSHYNLDINDPRGWFPPFYNRGPFAAFFRCHPFIGVELVVKFVNFATKQWTNDFAHKKITIPAIEVSYESKPRYFTGNESVYYWFRDTAGAPHSVVSALQALEKFLIDQSDKSNDIGPFVDFILKQGTSAALLGVLNSVGKYDPKHYLKSLNALLPVADFYFLEKDLDFGGGGIEGYQMTGAYRFDPRTWELAKEWHNMPQRRMSMGAVCRTLFMDNEKLREQYTEITAEWTVLLGRIDNRRTSDYLKRLISFFDFSNYFKQETESGHSWAYKEPEALSRQLESARSDAELGLDLFAYPFQCLEAIKNGRKLDLAECEGLWQSVLSIDETEEEYLYISYGGRHQCVLAGCAFLFENKEIWIAHYPEIKEWTITFIEKALKNYQPLPNSFYQTDMEDSWSSFASRILASVWSEDLNNKQVRTLIAELVLKCPFDNLSILFNETAKYVSWSESDFVQLQNLVVLVALGRDKDYSAKLPNYGIERPAIEQKPFDFNKIAEEIIQDFICSRIESKLIDWSQLREIKSKNNGSWDFNDQNFEKRPGINKVMLHHAFVVAPDLEGLSQEDRRHLCQLWRQMLEQMLFERGQIQENFSHRSEYPDEFDIWILGRISRIVLDIEEGDNLIGEELWKPFFEYGPQMAEWIVVFIENYFIKNIEREDKKNVFYKCWISMIEFAESCETWKRDRYYSGKDINQALLSINETMINWWNNDKYAFFYDKAILEVIKWGQKNRFDQDVVYRILLLLKTTPGLNFIKEGLDIVNRYLALSRIGDKIGPPKEYVKREFKYEHSLAGTASFLWENCSSQIKADNEVLKGFKEIVTYLVSRQNPIGLELQERILL
ncbi:hypothetical protein SAMN02927916_1238 [Flavobacterium anhuiense]|uniref:AAA+ ATPase domain-containing protein n=1 Tax=Flavobacterium anhuiense TaxID=459526 RepID=A0ABY0LG47_9FLAO|nr:ATP-binding protein [Flavobacterium anhuiense]SCY13939.1 hypothetical protein SAMN02927916_1238 [Flavobacterium anhuiense]